MPGALIQQAELRLSRGKGVRLGQNGPSRGMRPNRPVKLQGADSSAGDLRF